MLGHADLATTELYTHVSDRRRREPTSARTRTRSAAIMGVDERSTRWPLLDLHNHTDRSYDAVNTLADYERAFGEGLFDVLAITDHNRIDGAVEVAEQASFPVIVGMELDTADGELIGLFLRDRIPPGAPRTRRAGSATRAASSTSSIRST